MNPFDPEANADAALLGGPCMPFLILMQVVGPVDRQPSDNPLQSVQPSGVVELSPDLFGECSMAMARGVRRFQSAAVESEAYVVVRHIALLMTQAYRREQRYCPPTVTPLPATLDQLGNDGYLAKDGDFKEPAWTCLGLDLEGHKLHFQYELRVPEGTRGRTFEVLARGRPVRQGPMIELRRVGTLSIDRSRIDVTPAQRQVL
jgi:hypothetical protein